MTDDALIVVDPVVGRAVSGIVPNADQQRGEALLESTFVDLGVLAQLDNRGSQILFGRPGTGKSHLLRLLAARTNLHPGHAAVFVDVRRLGSAQLMTNTDKPLSVRSVSLFRDLLGELQSHLLDLATDPDQPERIDALESVSDLAATIATVSTRITGRDITREAGESGGGSQEVSATIAARPSLAVRAGSSQNYSEKFAERYTEVFEDTISFTEVVTSLERVVRTLGLDSVLLILDEWSTISPEVQPHVAEFLKRSIIPGSRISLKIASLTYGSNFSLTVGDRRIGFAAGQHRCGRPASGGTA